MRLACATDPWKDVVAVEHRPAAVLGTVALVILVQVILGHVAPAGSQPLVLRTQAIEIVDAGGRRRITLDAVGGRPAVWLYDSHNRRRIGLTIGVGDVPEVVLADHTGRPRLLLRTDAERAAEVGLTDALGRPRIGLKVNAGDPHVWLFEDPTGRISFAAP
jgi:hypothetical protein